MTVVTEQQDYDVFRYEQATACEHSDLFFLFIVIQLFSYTHYSALH